MDTDDRVYLGVWTNWSRGSAVMGATLTTTQKSGNILIAFTAIFVPFVASRLWKMLCFAFHTCTSKKGAQDAIYHQRQVVLRNSPSPDSGLFSLLLLAWTWRKLHVKAILRLLPLLVFAILFIVGFTVAGGYSSQITSAMGDEVLIKGDDCGLLTWSLDNTNINSTLAINTWMANKMNDAANYVQQCYTNQGTNLFDCNRFVVQSLPTTSDSNSGCPFTPGVCRENDTNIRLDTGYLDSNDHLGLNAPREQRFMWRQVLSCAPLRTEDYTTSYSHLNKTFVGYSYGGHSATAVNKTSLDFTYSVPDLQAQYSQSQNTNTGLNFRVSHFHDGTKMWITSGIHRCYAHIRNITNSFIHSAQSSRSYNGSLVQNESTFVPGHAIASVDGDIIIVFLSGNGVVFAQKSDDTWYNATRARGILGSAHAKTAGKAYMTAEAASPLGCKQQFQWCNPEYGVPEGCGPLAGWMDATAGAYPLFNLTVDDFDSADASVPDTERGNRLDWAAKINTLSKSGIYNMLMTFAAKALASQTLLASGVQLSISKQQWHLDVTNWWNTTLALHQAAFVDTALGYSRADANLQSSIVMPGNDQERHLCQSQKIRHSGFASFSLFGLLFTFILGALIVLMSFALDPIMRCLHTRQKYRQYEYLEWRTNGALQLHRLAQDELGYGKWSGCTDTVPVTRPEDRLADLDIDDLKYPRLSRGLLGEEAKPEAVNSQTATVVSLQGSSEASEDTVTNADAEHASIEPGHTSEAGDESNLVLGANE
ncbi:hypothetical protein PG985_008051 [Apiospora marii]|uniref:uncharacterized protein n=1 Tax=Apiospora marii TaxID=335849 RepID=UPI00312E02A4